MARVVIDTEGIRSLAQYTQGALNELARIRTELLRAQAQLDHGPGADAFGRLLGALTDFATVIDDDRRSLVSEVLSVEAEEGITALALATTYTPSAPTPAGSRAMVAFIPVVSLAAVRDPLPPPEPWNTTWVTPSGTIPIGANTRTMSHSPGTPEDYNIGDRWETKSESDSAAGHNASWASHEIRISGGTGTSESTDARGNTTYSWEQYQEMVLKAQAGTAGNLGPIDYRGEVTAQAGAEANIHVWARGGPDGYAIGGEAHAAVYAEATASAEISNSDVGSADVHATASTGAGADAHGKAGVDKDGISGGAGAEAYAGNDVKVGAGGELGPLKGSREISVGTGIGVGVSADFSFDWDDIGFDLGGKLGLGISLGIDTSLHISPSGIVDGIEAALNGDNPFDASGGEWDHQAADAAERAAEQQADHARNDLLHDTVATGDVPSSQPADLR